MARLLSRLSRLCLGKHVVLRSSSLRLLSKGFSSSLLQHPPCVIINATPCGEDLGKLVIQNADEEDCRELEKNVHMDLVYNDDSIVTIGASHGWVATLKEDDGILRLQDDLNPFASYTHPKRIPLPPLVTLPHCQTRIVTNVSMSSSSPEDQDCKFLGPQLSFCSNSEWNNIRIENPCFYSSRVMFPTRMTCFACPDLEAHLIGSWGLGKLKDKPKLQKLRFQNIPKLTKTKRELLDSCSTTEHLVESRPTGEIFLVKWYKKTFKISKAGIAKMKTKAVMVFKLDEQGNAVYTQDIGDLAIFLSKSEPFCVHANSNPALFPSCVDLMDFDEIAFADLGDSSIFTRYANYTAPYNVPPQIKNVD